MRGAAFAGSKAAVPTVAHHSALACESCLGSPTRTAVGGTRRLRIGSPARAWWACATVPRRAPSTATERRRWASLTGLGTLRSAVEAHRAHEGGRSGHPCNSNVTGV